VVTRSPRRPRRPRTTATLAAAVTATLVFTGSTSGATLAAWNDTEYTNATAGTLDCAVNSDQFASRASGKLVGGQLLGLNLDSLVNLRGVETLNTGTTTTATPAPPISQARDADTFVNPLSVGVLNGMSDAGGLNINVIDFDLPLATGTGLINQFGQARDSGMSVGAAGAVNDSGAAQLTPVAAGTEPPTLATVRLGQLVSSITGQALGSSIANLTDVQLRVGEVASVASLNACTAEWGGNIYDSLARNYVLSALDLDLTSPLVGAVVTDVQGIVTGVDALVEGLAGPGGTVDTLVTGGVSQLLGTTLQTLGLGDVRISSLNVGINLAGVNALLDDTISDSRGIVSVNLSSGIIGVDLAGLLGSVYGTTGLNGLPPNTQLLINAAAINALTVAITEALNNWVSGLTTALSSALRNMTISAGVDVLLTTGLTGEVARVSLSIPNTSLAALQANTAPITANVTLLGLTCNPPNPIPPLYIPSLGCVVSGIVGGLVNPLIAGLGAVLANALDVAIFDTAGTGGLLRSTTTLLTNVTAPLITFVGSATRGLFGENALLSLTANAQNAPNPALPRGTSVPRWAATLPGPDPSTRSTGRYDVSALRLSALGVLGGGLAVELDIARSSVGQNRVID
jgi:hypothetical protein